MKAGIGVPIDVRQHGALRGNARGFQRLQDLPGGAAELEVAGDGGVRDSVRLAGSLEDTTLEGRDAPVPGADLYDARTDPGRPLPRTGVVGGFAPLRDIAYEELGKFFRRSPVYPVLRRVVRLPVYAGSEHYVQSAASRDVGHTLRVPAKPDGGQLDEGIDSGLAQLDGLSGRLLQVVQLLTAQQRRPHEQVLVHVGLPELPRVYVPQDGADLLLT